MPEPIAAPSAPTAPTPPPAAAPQPSGPTRSISPVAAHAENFGPEGSVVPEDGSAVSAEKAAAQIARRDKTTGQFVPGARKAQKTFQHITQLTARAKGAEERAAAAERALSERTQAAPAAAAQSRQDAPAVAPRTIAEPPPPPLPTIKPASEDPEPREDDPAFGGDYVKYLRAQARWDTRQELREQAAAVTQAHQQRVQQQAYLTTMSNWESRVQAAKAKIPDFEAIAFRNQPGVPPIPPGSAADAWIMEDEHGPLVLYHLQTHPQELIEILRAPIQQQVRRLARLSDRLASDGTPAQAGTTGAAAGRSWTPPTRPPTPVRTEASRAPEGPPEGRALSIAEHAKWYGPRAAHKR